MSENVLQDAFAGKQNTCHFFTLLAAIDRESV